MWAELTYFSEDLSSARYRDSANEVENKFGVRCKIATVPEAVGIKVTLRLETSEGIYRQLQKILFEDGIGFPAGIECDNETSSIIEGLRHEQMEKNTRFANSALRYYGIKQSLSR